MRNSRENFNVKLTCSKSEIHMKMLNTGDFHEEIHVKFGAFVTWLWNRQVAL